MAAMTLVTYLFKWEGIVVSDETDPDEALRKFTAGLYDIGAQCGRHELRNCDNSLPEMLPARWRKRIALVREALTCESSIPRGAHEPEAATQYTPTRKK